jgi:iron complex transport system permease protein
LTQTTLTKEQPKSKKHLKAALSQNPKHHLLLLSLLLLVVFVLSLFFGRYPRPGLMNPAILWEDQLAMRLVLYLRLPRLLTAMLLGMSLAAAGNVFQMLFSNPLVEPGFLGVSQGAAFGAGIAIIFFGGAAVMVQSLAMVFAFVGLGTSYLLAKRVRFGGWVLRLVLAGIVVSALFSAGLGVLKYLADPLSQLQELTFWMLGGLWSITWTELKSILIPVLIGLFIIFRMRWRLNLLALDDEISFSLGVSPAQERALLLFAGVTATAAVVSVSGMVGWVGLIIPHITRRIFGANSQYTVPASMLAGAIFAILCDDIGRTLLAGEIPLGILTSLLGAGIFVILMTSRPMKVGHRS